MRRRVPDDRARVRRSTAASLRWDFAILVGFLVLVGVLRFVADGVVAAGLAVQTEATIEAGRANDAVLQALTDAETGIRGYQLTGQKVFLEPYRSGMQAYPVSMSKALAVAPTADIRRLLSAEQAAANAWLTEFAGPVASSAPQGADRERAGSARGKALFDKLRAANAAVVAALDRMQQRLISRFRTATAVSEAVLAALSVASALLALVIAVRIGRLLLRPLDRLHASLLRRAAGDHDARAPEEGPPEIRMVMRTLNDLLDEATRRQAAEAGRVRLRMAALELRSRVAQRLDWSGMLDEAGEVIGPAVQADRVYLYATGDEDTLPAARQWHRAGLSPVPLPVVPPPVTGTEPVIGPDDADLPPPLAGYLRDAGAASYVFVPFGAGTAAAGGLLVAGCVGPGDPAGPREWSGDVLAFLEGAATDITRALDQVRLDEQQEELVNRLRELNQRRTEFINMVSHDLRGPLTSILSYVEDMAEEDDGLTDQQRNGLAVIKRNTSRITAMADELLTLARAESQARPLDARPIRLAELVGGVIATMDPAAAKGGLTLRSEVPADVWVEGDAGQLERALMNLVGNAVKFTPPGGRVTISAAERLTGGVRVAVSDTGIGIPESERETLFEPFRRARNATGAGIPGTGLGLAVVRAVVQQHRGSVALESTEGAGTVITLTLPSCPADRRGEPAAARDTVSERARPSC